MTNVVRTACGWGIEINGEIVEDGFLNERSAKRNAEAAERQYALSHDADHDADYVAFRAFQSAVEQAKHFAHLSASVGETASAEDIAADLSEREIYDQKVREYLLEAEENYKGAKRWDSTISFPSYLKR